MSTQEGNSTSQPAPERETDRFRSIPVELRDIPHWVNWRHEKRDGKPTKVPYCPTTGKRADTKKPTTWTSSQEALAAYANGGYDGIGYVFSKDDPYCGIDLDCCISLETGETDPRSQELVRKLNSYTERTPSGKGLHIIVKGKLPAGRRRKDNIEMYDDGRYFTFTGDHIPGTPATVEDRLAVLSEIHAEVFMRKGAAPTRNNDNPPPVRAPLALSDQELINKAIAAKNGWIFDQLWRGDWQGAGYSSPSEADAALLGKLRFWTRGDKARSFALFAQSGLSRGKWTDRDDYRERTWLAVDKGDVYHPGRKSAQGKLSAASTAPSEALEIRSTLWTISRTPGIDKVERGQRSASAVLKWLHNRGRFFRKIDKPDFAGSMYFDSIRKDLRNIQSDVFQAWLSDCIEVNRAERLYKIIHAAIETESLSSRSTSVQPAIYWAGRPDTFYISCGPGKMIRIRSEEVDVVDNGTDDVLFEVSGCLPEWKLTRPVNPFDTCRLFSEMSASPEGKMIIALWTVSLPTNPQCKPPLCLSSHVGGGKTALVRGLFRIFGIPPNINSLTKRGEENFWVAVDGGGLTCFDNVDTKVDWFPDAVASAATGGSSQQRKLYTNNESITLHARAWIAITSSNPFFAADPGLADRLLNVRLNRRAGQTYDTELYEQIDHHRDAILSFIANILSKALAERTPHIPGLNQRHPDWASMAVRIGRAMGREQDAVNAIQRAEVDKSLFNIENDSIGSVLLEVMKHGEFRGTTSQLLGRMKQIDANIDGHLSQKTLAKRLSKLWPSLEVLFKAKKDLDGHRKQNVYILLSPESAGIAGIGAAYSEKSYVEANLGDLSQTPPENPQYPQEQPTPEYVPVCGVAQSLVTPTEGEL